MNHARPALAVAPVLIGATLEMDDGIVVRIVEVEAYGGADDPAAMHFAAQPVATRRCSGRQTIGTCTSATGCIGA